jgi:hypothetical protein
MGVLSWAVKMICEVQRKRNNEKIIRRKISFSIYKTHFFIFFPFSFKPHNFFIFINFKWFKMLQDHPLKFYKSSLNSNNNRATYKEIFGCSASDLFNVCWFVFNNCQCVRCVKERVQVLFGHEKQQNLPLGSDLLKTLKCLITNQFTLLILIILPPRSLLVLLHLLYKNLLMTWMSKLSRVFSSDNGHCYMFVAVVTTSKCC